MWYRTNIAFNTGFVLVPATDTWYYVVCQYESATLDGAVSVNGAAMEYGDNATAVAAATTNDFTIGANVVGLGGSDADIDSVAFWDRLLTTDEIAELYNDGNGIGYADL